MGATLPVTDSSGTKLDITVEQVIDPASGASQYSQPASGKHFVGVKLRIRNAAAIIYQNNANNETTIMLSDGKAEDADYNPIAGCGNFSNGQVKLASQASVTGCVTFQVGNGEKVAEVRYHNTVFPGTTAAAMIGAGVLSVLVYPFIAVTLHRSTLLKLAEARSTTAEPAAETSPLPENPGHEPKAGPGG